MRLDVLSRVVYGDGWRSDDESIDRREGIQPIIEPVLAVIFLLLLSIVVGFYDQTSARRMDGTFAKGRRWGAPDQRPPSSGLGKGLRMDASALLNEDLGDRIQPRKAALPTTDAQLGV